MLARIHFLCEANPVTWLTSSNTNLSSHFPTDTVLFLSLTESHVCSAGCSSAPSDLCFLALIFSLHTFFHNSLHFLLLCGSPFSLCNCPISSPSKEKLLRCCPRVQQHTVVVVTPAYPSSTSPYSSSLLPCSNISIHRRLVRLVRVTPSSYCIF